MRTSSSRIRSALISLMEAAFCASAFQVSFSISNSRTVAKRMARSSRRRSSENRCLGSPMARINFALRSDRPSTKSITSFLAGSKNIPLTVKSRRRASSSMVEESFILKVETVHRTARFATFVRRRLRSIAPTFGRGWFLPQSVNDKADYCDADAGVGDVEGRPRIGEANVQIEEKEIGDVTVDDSVGEVAHDASEKQRQGEVAPGIWVTLFAQTSEKHVNHCDQ